jgi:hypothetical protein
MKEQEMRQMVRALLGQTMRRVVIPASLGIGLALGGCDHRAVPVQGDGAIEQEIDQGSPARYATPFPTPDAGPGRDLRPDKPAPPLDGDPGNALMYGVPFPIEPDAGMAGRYGTPFPGKDAG